MITKWYIERKIFQLKDPSPIKDVHYFCHVIHTLHYRLQRIIQSREINVVEIINYDVQSLIMIKMMESSITTNNKKRSLCESPGMFMCVISHSQK